MMPSTVTRNLLTFLTCFVKFSSGDPHTLQIFDTGVTPGIHFPEFISVSQLDGVQIEYYDSNIGRNIPKTEWIRRISDDDPEYWDSYTEVMQASQEIFRGSLGTVMQRYNQTEGVHTVQRMYGCELDDDGSTRGYYQDGYDGEDFISLDLSSGTWIAPTPQSVITKYIWDADVTWANIVNNFLEEECIESLKKYLVYGRETLEQKVGPEVSVFEKHSPSPEVVCHATGFFPKAVMITWQKDGEDVHEDVELRETLPNQDGSFQKRSILKVPAEELQKHNYTCVVQDSSLEKELVREVPKGGGSDGGPDGGLDTETEGGGSDGQSEEGSGEAPIAIIAAVVMSLIVLIAVVAGIVVLKKKNSGGRRKEADVKYSQNGSCIIDS